MLLTFLQVFGLDEEYLFLSLLLLISLISMNTPIALWYLKSTQRDFDIVDLESLEFRQQAQHLRKLRILHVVLRDQDAHRGTTCQKVGRCLRLTCISRRKSTLRLKCSWPSQNNYLTHGPHKSDGSLP